MNDIQIPTPEKFAEHYGRWDAPADIGHGERIYGLTMQVDGELVLCGLIENHPRRRQTTYTHTDGRVSVQEPGSDCGGLLHFDLPWTQQDSVRWRVESWFPLTLSPSLLCTVCGNHGFIREGRWVPA